MSAIRILAICLFRRESRILVAQGFDAWKEEAFLRPLGGGVEFGELAVDALRREIREELNAEIAEPVQLGVLENIFSYQGQPGHEIVFVFDARFVDQELYNLESLTLNEEDIWDGPARWIDLNEAQSFNLYPDGLTTLVKNTT